MQDMVFDAEVYESKRRKNEEKAEYDIQPVIKRPFLEDFDLKQSYVAHCFFPACSASRIVPVESDKRKIVAVRMASRRRSRSL
jgi:hypothetical protein